LNIPVPKAKAGEAELDGRFTYDNNRLLEADVRIQMTGERHKLVIENNPGVMTPAEIRERLKVLEALKVHPREQQVNTH
ncbi:molecular chaperone HscC, partial [Pseudomonas syringae pv. tagetis]